MKKNTRGCEKHVCFFIDFPWKIDQKSIKKSTKTVFATKIDKKAFPGALFVAKSRFLVDFGVPEGTQKLLKIYETFWVKGSWEPSGSHFERFSAFVSILARFWLDFGYPRPHSGSNLIVFFVVFWLFFCCFLLSYLAALLLCGFAAFLLSCFTALLQGQKRQPSHPHPNRYGLAEYPYIIQSKIQLVRRNARSV